jgi:hypothetical protein
MKFILILSVLISLFSCKGSSPTPVSLTSVFNPTSPDTGSGGVNRIPNVLNLTTKMDLSTNKVTLKWLIPSTYTNQSYEIYIYRLEGDGIVVPLEDPSTLYSIDSIYYPVSNFLPITSSQYSDSTTLNSGTQYTYYVYIKSGSDWSSESKITITVGSTSAPASLPSVASFWPSYVQTIATPPAAPNAISSNTLSPGMATSSNPTGGCAFTTDSSIMYCADTENNRVIIYQNNVYLYCKDSRAYGEDIYQYCVSMNKNSPFTAMAVLGQNDIYSNYPCGNPKAPPSDSCFTKPSGVMVADGKLFVSDSGNDRIMIHSTLPTNGCFNVLETGGGVSLEHQCAFSGVVGKKSLSDMVKYNVTVNGESSLSHPTGLAYKASGGSPGGDLYIADTGNHRLVVARKVSLTAYWNCINTTWGTSKCSFDGLLGQENYRSQRNFANEYSLGNYSYDTTGNNINKKDSLGNSTSDHGFFLSHYFASPNRIFFNGDNLLISSNEKFLDSGTLPAVQMNSRIVVFKNDPLSGVSPICNRSNFNLDPLDLSITKCAYDYAIGQSKPSELITTNISSGQEYKDIRYSLTDVDFTLTTGNTLVGIDRILNRVYIWADYTAHLSAAGIPDSSGFPYDFFVSNPNGATTSTTPSRILPDLKNLNDIFYDVSGGSLYLQDSQLGHIYQIPLLK